MYDRFEATGKGFRGLDGLDCESKWVECHEKAMSEFDKGVKLLEAFETEVNNLAVEWECTMVFPLPKVKLLSAHWYIGGISTLRNSNVPPFKTSFATGIEIVAMRALGVWITPSLPDSSSATRPGFPFMANQNTIVMEWLCSDSGYSGIRSRP
ncbi:hypothetical protein F5144DRAFT_607626 [Chaetomium tenue]|uniref:Uncharacterized protein n=1 Tax=Chaetomium tenue TaxID=1854479 RepID=A0ACB7PPB0_9PEZI|nr:hypothetical protein F5144DRAFT_607626 [Chaetomium globosum]